MVSETYNTGVRDCMSRRLVRLRGRLQPKKAKQTDYQQQHQGCTSTSGTNSVNGHALADEQEGKAPLLAHLKQCDPERVHIQRRRLHPPHRNSEHSVTFREHSGNIQ
jgi:hypothetical protein